MICPACKAEYRQGFTVCADCEVPLVAQLSALAAHALLPLERDNETADTYGEPLNEDPFCAFWQGEDVRVHAELCAVLRDASIPYKTIRREDHLFRLNATSALKIGVPFSLYEKAEAAVKQAFGDDAHESETVRLLASPEPENSNAAMPDFGAAAHSRAHFDPRQFFPEDAVAEVWSGEEFLMADFLVQAFQTNEIHSRWVKQGGRQRLYVQPQDAVRAREIVREILEGTPPSD